MIVGGIALVLLIVGVIVSMDTGGDDNDEPGISQFAEAEISGEELPRFDSASGADPAVGSPIPEISGESFDGTPVSIERGVPQAIVFLAHWCGHCQAEVPEVQAWLDEGSLPNGVQLKSVATGTDVGRPNYPPSAWLTRESWTPPVLVDDASGSVSDAFGLPAFPYWVFADSDGNVVARWAGGLPIDVLDSIVNDLS